MNITKYTDLTPSFRKIMNLLSSNGKSKIPIMDHFAIRSFNLSQSSLPLTKAGFYQQRNSFSFPNHHAEATWFYNSKYIIPRAFTSQYMSVFTDPKLINSDLDLQCVNYYIVNPKTKLPYRLYQNLIDKNQYLAWLLVHRELVNHIAIETDDIYKTTDIIDMFGYKINNSENPIQISNDGLLLQSSIQADKIKIPFLEKLEWVPGGFVEFIERKIDVATGEKREGFETDNANIIFDSTKKMA